MLSTELLAELDPFSVFMAPVFLMVTVSLFLEPLWSRGAREERQTA